MQSLVTFQQLVHNVTTDLKSIKRIRTVQLELQNTLEFNKYFLH
jgi:hypothetical protein